MTLHGKEIKIFTANANPILGRRIAAELGMPLGESVTERFSDGEIAVSIKETVRGCDVFFKEQRRMPVGKRAISN